MSNALARPAQVCGALLAALEAAEGRRKSRKRDQTPDALGLAAKRELLECARRDDPEPEAFEAWLLHYVNAERGKSSHAAICAMARAVLEEWRLSRQLREFGLWLEAGAPSADVAMTAQTPRAAPPAEDRGGNTT